MFFPIWLSFRLYQGSLWFDCKADLRKKTLDGTKAERGGGFPSLLVVSWAPGAPKSPSFLAFF